MGVQEKEYIKTDDVYIYERDGETIYRRKFMDYDNREVISTETMEAEAKHQKILAYCEKLDAESLKIQQGWFAQWEKK